MNCGKEPKSKASTLALLISEFIGQDGCHPRSECFPEGEFEVFQKKQIKVAIIEATQARLGKGVRPDGTRKLHSHQRYLPQQTANDAQEILLKESNGIKSCKDFDNLHELIKSQILTIHFVGELYCYDTAFRIGISMDIFPEKIYLHSGTRKGAIALGLYERGKEFLEVKDLLEKYSEFAELKAYQIEDFLCLKKDLLHKFKRP